MSLAPRSHYAYTAEGVDNTLWWFKAGPMFSGNVGIAYDGTLEFSLGAFSGSFSEGLWRKLRIMSTAYGNFGATGRVAACLIGCCNSHYMYRACPSSCESTPSSSLLIGRIIDGYRILVSVFFRGKRNSPMSTMICILFPEWPLFVVHVPYHTGGRMMQNT